MSNPYLLSRQNRTLDLLPQVIPLLDDPSQTPSLIDDVLPALRNAAHSNPHLFPAVAPLLARLFATLLNPEIPTLHPHVSKTIIVFVHSLIARQKLNTAQAFIQDLAHALILLSCPRQRLQRTRKYQESLALLEKFANAAQKEEENSFPTVVAKKTDGNRNALLRLAADLLPVSGCSEDALRIWRSLGRGVLGGLVAAGLRVCEMGYWNADILLFFAVTMHGNLLGPQGKLRVRLLVENFVESAYGVRLGTSEGRNSETKRRKLAGGIQRGLTRELAEKVLELVLGDSCGPKISGILRRKNNPKLGGIRLLGVSGADDRSCDVDYLATCIEILERSAEKISAPTYFTAPCSLEELITYLNVFLIEVQRNGESLKKVSKSGTPNEAQVMGLLSHALSADMLEKISSNGGVRRLMWTVAATLHRLACNSPSGLSKLAEETLSYLSTLHFDHDEPVLSLVRSAGLAIGCCAVNRDRNRGELVIDRVLQSRLCGAEECVSHIAKGMKSMSDRLVRELVDRRLALGYLIKLAPNCMIREIVDAICDSLWTDPRRGITFVRQALENEDQVLQISVQRWNMLTSRISTETGQRAAGWVNAMSGWASGKERNSQDGFVRDTRGENGRFREKIKIPSKDMLEVLAFLGGLRSDALKQSSLTALSALVHLYISTHLEGSYKCRRLVYGALIEASAAQDLDLQTFLISNLNDLLLPLCSHMIQDDSFFLALCDLLGVENPDMLWKRAAKCTLAEFIRGNNFGIIGELGKKVGQSMKQLTEGACAEVIAQAFLSDSTSEPAEEGLAAIRDILQSDTGALVKTNIGKITQRLAVELGSPKEETAKSALESLAHYTKELDGRALMQKHFMLVMESVNRGLFPSWVTLKSRMTMLKTLSSILRYMGRKVKLFVPKVMATLKLALSSASKDAPEVSSVIRLWATFLTALGSDVGPHLSSAVSVLVPFLHSYADIIVPVIVNIVETTALEEGYLNDLGFLVDTVAHPSLSIVSAAIEEQCKSSVQQASVGGEVGAEVDPAASDFLSKINERLLWIATEHESSEIRAFGLDRLLDALVKERVAMPRVSRYIVRAGGSRDKLEESNFKDGSSSMEKALSALFSRMVRKLTKCLIDDNHLCRERAARCLGEIGAIDPRYLSSHAVHQQSQTFEGVLGRMTKVLVAPETYISNPRALVSKLLHHFLIPSLRRSDPSTVGHRQNQVGFAIQELLKSCGCTVDTPQLAKTVSIERESYGFSEEENGWEQLHGHVISEELAAQFWARLDPEDQSAVTPYLAAPYTLATVSTGSPYMRNTGPTLDVKRIWKEVRNTTKWIKTLAYRIAEYVQNDQKLGQIFSALRPVLRHEFLLATYILPFVIREAVDVALAPGITAGEDLRDKVLSIDKSVGNAGTVFDGQLCGNELQHPNEVVRFIIDEFIAAMAEDNEAAHAIFSLLDILSGWREKRVLVRLKEEKRKYAAALRSAKRDKSRRGKTVAELVAPSYERIASEDPITALADLNGRAQIPLLLLARTALRSRSHARALLYLEQHIRLLRSQRNLAAWPAYVGRLIENVDESQELQMMQRIYAELEDSDAISGVATLRQETSLAEMIIDAEVRGRYDDALISYERALTASSRDPKLHAGFLRCLRTLGHWETMLTHADGLISTTNGEENSLKSVASAIGVEAAWRLGRWDRLQRLTSHNDSLVDCGGWEPAYELAVGKMFLSLKQNDLKGLANAASAARSAVLEPIRSMAAEGYSRIYPFVARLHALSDIEDSVSLLAGKNEDSCTLVLMNCRTDLASQSLRICEPILSTRRVCLKLFGRRSDAIEVDLELSKYFCDSGNLRAAAASAYRARSIVPENSDVSSDVSLQIAKIIYAQGDTTNGILTVSKEIERMEKLLSGRVVVKRTSSLNRRLASAHMLAGKWKEESRSAPSSVILNHYLRAADLNEGEEGIFYALGRHYDMLHRSSAAAMSGDSLHVYAKSVQRSTPSKGTAKSHLEYVPLIIRNFATSLHLGHAKLFEALPRMLTVWLDFYTDVEDKVTKVTASIERKVYTASQTAFGMVPSYMWMTVMPQMLSRLLHPSNVVREWLTRLIACCVAYFPDQAVWLVAPATRLKYKARATAVTKAIQKGESWFKKSSGRSATQARELNKKTSDTISAGLNIIKELIVISSDIVKNKKPGMYATGSEFDRLRSHFPANVIVPTLSALTVILPAGDSPEPHFAYRPTAVCIHDLENRVVVMSSAMRPRRIGFIGSDGRTYRFLAKKEDHGDMRKDSRLVEFMTVVNRLLEKDRKSRIRNLRLKTYGVLPLTEETGMIEWVNNLMTLREIVRTEHVRVGVSQSSREIVKSYDNSEDKVAWLEQWALPRYPAVMHRFFLTRFGSNPGSWYDARTRWTRSVALWSMTGHIIGLGDRHCENILVETTNGNCVHVDFAMLFEKGRSLRVPEIVPFRLTQNMVDAMGVQGYEGCFRATCEISLAVLRNNSDALMGVLESFLHDPLADWKNIATQRDKSPTEYAMETRLAVEQKLKGVVDTGLPLSIQGQVERLIHDASNVQNLGQMYIWWCPWI